MGNAFSFNGSQWVVGTPIGVFQSPTGQNPWTRVDPGFGVMRWTGFANRGRALFSVFTMLPFPIADGFKPSTGP